MKFEAPSVRQCYVIGFIYGAALLCAAAYLQLVKGFAPCPLCQVQRIFFALVILMFFFASLMPPTPRSTKLYGGFILLFCILGAMVAIRQLWLQANPPVDQSCGVGLSYLLSTLSLSESIKLILMGTGDCATVHWRFLGLSIPAWSLVNFVLLAVLGVAQIRRVKH